MDILLVDDEDQSREALHDFLSEQLHYTVYQCRNGVEALRLIEKNRFHIVLSDVKMPKMNGIELLQSINQQGLGNSPAVILMTGYGDIQTAITALRAGAYDYLLKPIEIEELALLIEKIKEHSQLVEENKKLNEQTTSLNKQLKHYQNAYRQVAGSREIITGSTKMQEALELAYKLHEDKNIPVLIDGETGTGKELIARAVHFGPEFHTSPFISLNCSSITPSLFESELFGYSAGAFTGADRKGRPGKIELAEGGTLFLDEIGDMPLELQPKLLRVLQEKEIFRVGGVQKKKINFRFIGATNKNLSELMEKGKFREDLFYRLNVARISIPPLRERKNDIQPLVNLFIKQFTTEKKKQFKAINPKAMMFLEKQPWPGNVRQLKNTIERVILIYDDTEIKVEHLEFLDDTHPKINYNNKIEVDPFNFILPQNKFDVAEFETKLVTTIFHKFNGNKTRMAAYMGISRSALRSWLKKMKS